ncbi:hypothetical protein GCM10008171_19760 [Methylopila jiangsuensis]|uniref:Uncharacterized protein n=1 Tax=Methylopila jiangsuensis TaxID=586230 RepID=A0A9W6N435_9HYPH|nr:hypothetical protein [Methylopila jiangsuensis]MDR6286928.1 hypothetical protein [Methylopila jiangsuensis]GLK76722.1 hypothetical protein GCM10008171_19760 [Methylopila jiangsuensis]
MTVTSEPSKRPPAPGAAKRRTLPQGRSPAYEIDFPKRPRGASTLKALFGALREAWSRGGDAVGDAYASGARVVLDRKEALEDLNAERRHGSRAQASTQNRTAELTSGS